MEFIKSLINVILHLDKELKEKVLEPYGSWWAYVLLFVIVFCETGLVVTPILPGDSLLFAAGSFAAEGWFNVHLLFILLFAAAVLGDALNYSIGRRMGMAVFDRKDSKIFKPQYLERTQKFFAKYGNKAIVLARFVPIVRTFAPFLAGVGTMPYRKFATYNILGGFVWVGFFTYGGWWFGNLEFVKKNFGFVIIGIIILSIMPMVIEILKARREARAQSVGA